jgi:hypothetical protein
MAGGILALHQHRRLYDARTGEQAMEWPDLPMANADSSIVSTGLAGAGLLAAVVGARGGGPCWFISRLNLLAISDFLAAVQAGILAD